MNAVRYGLLALAGLALSACVAAGDIEALAGHDGRAAAGRPPAQNALDDLAYRATDSLINGSAQRLYPGSAVLVATLVDIDDFRTSSTFGRLVSEQASSRLVQKGYKVSEVGLRHSLLVKEGGGKFILSRSLQEIGQDSDADAILAGTYAVGAKWIHVNMRLVEAVSGQVMSSVDFVVAMDREARTLVASR